MRTYKAFVSSTYLDLKEHRAHVIDALRNAGFHVDPMEDWTADSHEPKILSVDRVDGCDLCILLVAFRRGTVPKGKTESITQMEYRYAIDNEIDVLPFLLDEDAEWRRRFDDLDKDPAVREWRDDLQERHVVGFFGLGPQTIQVAPALTRWVQRKKDTEGPAISYWLGRPSLEDGFVGREDDMRALEDAFAARRAVVISGGPGTGKSRLAAEYVHACGLDGFWSEGGSDVASTLVGLAPALDVEVEGRGDDEIARDVRKTLSTLSRDTFWVVDNLPDLGLVSELFGAAGPVRLLITSRDGRDELLPGTVAFEGLSGLGPDPAIALLGSRGVRDGAHPALAEMAKAVAGLPLALEMLAVLLGQPRQTPQRVLEQMLKAPPAIDLRASQEGAGSSIPRTDSVFAAIAGTLAALPEDIREQISPLGYMADAPLPYALVAALAGIQEDGLDRLLGECSRRSVLRREETYVVVHALTTAAIGATNADGALQTALERARPRLAAISTDDPVALRAELAHHEQLHSIAKGKLGDEYLSVLHLANSLAIAYGTAGRTDEGVRLHEETLAVRERVLGPEHPDTLKSRNNLANGYAAAGRTEDALRLDEDTLAVVERVLGPEHPDTLASRNNLAAGYAAAGRTEEAVRLDEETLPARERVLGPEHPDTLKSRGNLAFGYRALGRTEEALRLDEQTLAARERVLGAEHPDTLVSRNNLAIAFRFAGRTEEAVRMDEETLSTRERVLGPEHPDTLISRNNLANGYRATGRTQEAIRILEQTQAALQRVLGPEHPDTVKTRQSLARAYRAAGRGVDADRLEGKAAKGKPKRKPRRKKPRQ